MVMRDKLCDDTTLYKTSQHESERILHVTLENFEPTRSNSPINDAVVATHCYFHDLLGGEPLFVRGIRHQRWDS